MSTAVLALWLAPVASGQEVNTVPFRLIDGWAVVVEGTLGGAAHQRMFIDTGAVPSTINRRVAKRLGISGSAEQISEVNRSVTVERVRVPRVQIGPVSVEDIGMLAVDLTTVEDALGTRIDAIIGLDVLARRNFTLDYGRKTLNFGSRMEGECVIGMDTRQEAGGTYVLVEVESGGQKLRLLLDTGSKDVTLFERGAAKKFAPVRVRSAEVTVTAAGIAGGRGGVDAVRVDRSEKAERVCNTHIGRRRPRI